MLIFRLTHMRYDSYFPVNYNFISFAGVFIFCLSLRKRQRLKKGVALRDGEPYNIR